MTYVIIARDGSDSDALARRLAARDAHLSRGEKMKKEGKALFAAALLEGGENMNGSVYVVDFSSREELNKWLEKEPYVVGKVWENIEIIPCKVPPAFVSK